MLNFVVIVSARWFGLFYSDVDCDNNGVGFCGDIIFAEMLLGIRQSAHIRTLYSPQQGIYIPFAQTRPETNSCFRSTIHSRR